jgi:hypothetical protein
MDSPPNLRFLRLLLAYVIGLNIFGLVIALTYAIGSLLNVLNVVGLIGGVVAIAAGIVAGWRTERALKRAFK